jgi:hypothetical protein
MLRFHEQHFMCTTLAVYVYVQYKVHSYKYVQNECGSYTFKKVRDFPKLFPGPGQREFGR